MSKLEGLAFKNGKREKYIIVFILIQNIFSHNLVGVQSAVI